jgi:hypothetical protein
MLHFRLYEDVDYAADHRSSVWVCKNGEFVNRKIERQFREKESGSLAQKALIWRF